MLTPEQIEKLNRIIDKKITAFVAENISINFFTTQEKDALRDMGIVVEMIKPKDLLLYQSFALGLISGAVPKTVLNETAYDSFKFYLDSGKFIPLNSYEKSVLRSVEKQTVSDIKGIGEKYKSKLQGGINNAERVYYEQTLKKNIKEGLAKKKALKSISNDIAKELDAFGRDFDRIVQTVSHQAFDEGRKAFFERNYGDDSEIYYEVYEGACSVCVKNYLTKGLGSKPRVFKIGSLPPPQVNYGKKKDDQVITSAPAHPYCRCNMQIKPKDFVWDDEKKIFIPLKKNSKQVDRKSKVKIEFGGKSYNV